MFNLLSIIQHFATTEELSVSANENVPMTFYNHTPRHPIYSSVKRPWPPVQTVSEIKPVSHIDFALFEAGGTFTGSDKLEIVARHNDNTNHIVGIYTSIEDFDEAVKAWKKKYLIKNE